MCENEYVLSVNRTNSACALPLKAAEAAALQDASARFEIKKIRNRHLLFRGTPAFLCGAET